MSLLDESTVLVLGAGASKPFGLPLGAELKAQLLSRVGNRQTRKDLMSLGHDEASMTAFRDALKYGVYPTVDIFLEKKANFRDLGSYLIASTIIPLEKHDLLFPQKDWYGDLFNVLCLEEEKPTTQALSVITLNYDRSFEHFLTMNIEYNCRHDKVASAHKKREMINIVHAHGSLGKYPDVPYGEKINQTDALTSAAKSIKIVSDHLDNSPDFQKAQSLLSDAQHIIFLGFGYNDVTLTSLFDKSDISKKKLYGTAMGLAPDDRTRVTNFFGDNITLGGKAQDCASFLKDIGLSHDN